MDWTSQMSQEILAWLPNILLALSAVLLGVVVWFLAKWILSLPASFAQSRLRRMPLLREAAKVAYKQAYRRNLPILKAAALNRTPEDILLWFEKSILRQVPVYGRRVPSNVVEIIDATQTRKMTVLIDGDSVGSMDSKQPIYVDLHVRPKDFKKYMRWAKTVR